jgi:arabinogalactan endo-1,4-beta-galactosidase
MAEFSNFLNYTKQAAKACRDACPQAKIVFHVAMSYTSVGNANNNSYIREWAQALKEQSFDYDIMGISYYPYYHGPLTELQTLLTYMKTNFPEKKIQLVEAGYPHKWYPGDAKYDYTAKYPDTNEGQKKFTQDLITLLNGYDNVNGLYWWWPEANEYWRKTGASQVTTDWYNMGLWDNENGKATPALYELKSFLNDPAGISEVRQSQTTTAPHKYLENGRIVISKGNRRFNALGQSL